MPLIRTISTAQSVMSGNKACKKMLRLELKNAIMHNPPPLLHAKGKKKRLKQDLNMLMPVSSKPKIGHQ